MFTVSHKRNDKVYNVEVSSRNELALADAMKKAAGYGLVDHCVSRDFIDANPKVVVLQDWWPDGTEEAVYMRTRGKYRGTTCGFSIRRK